MRKRPRPFALLVVFSCVSLSAQTPLAPQLPAGTAAPFPSAPGISGALGQFAGGIPSGQAVPGVMPLTLQDAIDRGLRQNLGLILGQQGTLGAESARLRALSNLLPNVVAKVSDAGEQINLKALGFSGFPGIPVIVGPFNVFDTRISASQNLFNLSALRNYRAGNESLRASQLSYRNARELVVMAVAGLYLQAGAGAARIDAVKAQRATAEALFRQAADMRSAGVAAGIDVLRAQVEMQAQQQRVIYFENEFEKQKLALARAIGLPVGQEISLPDKLPYAPAPPVTFEQALDEAYRSRPDLHSAQALVAAAELTLRAAQAERLPSLGFDGNYCAIGPRPWDSHGTFTAAVSLFIPVFQGGRVRAAVLAADSALAQRRALLEDLRAGIHYELRTSFLDLKAAGQQLDVARSAVDLAGQELAQARDRFSAGVANSVEVVQAQQAVATANDNYISSLYAFNLAKVSLARAAGTLERSSKHFLGGTP
jgi:outer membrane protein TolC